MSWFALALALGASPPAPPPTPLRVVQTPFIHVGVRPAAIVSSEERGAGVTVQVTLPVL